MRTTSIRVFVVVISILAIFGGCSRRSQNSVMLAGSTAFQPFAEKLAEHYIEANPTIQVNVQGGGSAVGIVSALTGAANIGVADLLDLPKEASELQSVIVARDGIAIIVNPKNRISNLTSDQIRGIFNGSIVSWLDLGGDDIPIRVISREDGSGTRSSFDKLVLGADDLSRDALYQDSNGTVREAVANDKSAIGYISMGIINDKVKAVTCDGASPSAQNVRNGKYRLARPIYFLTKGERLPSVAAFIEYVLSAPAQEILEKEGLVRAK